MKKQPENLWHILYLLLFFFTRIEKGLLTDIEEASYLVDYSLGFRILIPVLSCYVKYNGYNKVTWYKDGIQVKNGTFDPSSHLFSISDLLKGQKFKNPFQLQGYYWCETNAPPADAVAHKYLFQIESVNTYVGSLFANKDFLANHNSSVTEKIAKMMKIYEQEMEDIMFGFLSKPNIFITDVQKEKNGFKIKFFIYAVQGFDSRLQGETRLVEDEHTLLDITEYIFNQTETDPDYYDNLLQWIIFRGINTSSFILKSTIGCYITKSSNSDLLIKEVTWPYTFLEQIAVVDEGCVTKEQKPLTRACEGSFNEGASWGIIDGVCENEPSHLTSALKELSKKYRQLGLAQSLNSFKGIIQEENNFTATDLVIAAKMLEKISNSMNFDIINSDDIFTCIDNLLNADLNELTTAETKLQFTSRILEIINTIVDKANSEHTPLEILRSSILVYTKDTDVGDTHVTGAFINPPQINSTFQGFPVEFLVNGTKFPYFNSEASFLLPTELVIKRELELILPCQLNLVYFNDWSLFNLFPILDIDIKDMRPAPVIMISLSGGPAWNLSDPVKLFFRHDFQAFIDNPVCVYFDPKRGNGGAWATEGCFYEGLINGYYVCNCHHLTIFSIILTEKQAISESAKFISHASLYVGCGISIIGLVLVILLYLASKRWRQVIDHSVLFHLSFSFFCSLVLLLSHDVHVNRKGCMFLTYAFYCSVLAMFCWFFVQSIVNHIRFSKKAEMSDIPHFLEMCICFAWGLPVAIIIILALSRKYGNHWQKTCWPTLKDVSNAAYIPILIFLSLAIFFNLNAAYSISCRYKKDLLVGSQKYKENVLKFRATMTLFIILILAWIFGYVALWTEGKEMQILFSIFIIISSVYITVFFIFHELSVPELLNKKKNPTSETIPEIKMYKSIND